MNNEEREELPLQLLIRIINGEFLNDPKYKFTYFKKQNGTYVVFLKNKIIGKGLNIDEHCNSFFSEIQIENCKIDTLLLRNLQNNFKVVISNDSDIENIYIAKCNLDTLSIFNCNEINNITLFKTTINFYFRIQRIKQINKLELGYSLIKEFYIGNSSIDDLTIHPICKIEEFILECNFLIKGITIEGINYFRKFQIYKNTIEKILISSSLEAFKILVNENVIEDIALGSNLKIDTINFRRNLVKGQISIGDNSDDDTTYINNLQVENDSVQKITIENSNIGKFINLQNCDSFIYFSNTFINELSYKGFVNSSKSLMQFISCHFNLITFINYLNSGNITFTNSFATNKINYLKTLEYTIHRKFLDIFENQYYLIGEKLQNPELYILNSDLGKTNFINTNLANFDKVFYANSKISEIFLGNIKFPNNVEIHNLSNEKVQKRQLYGQLKKLYENTGNRIEALEYSAKEMEIYQEQINKGDIKPIKGEKIQILFNWYTNRHTTSWQQGLWITFFVSAYLYLCYCLLINDYGCDMSQVLKYFPYYFNFLNPVHKIDFLTSENNFKFDCLKWNYGFALAIDFISRLIIPILAYQMIQAFRKYGK